MTLPVVADTCRIEIAGTLIGGDRWMNVIYGGIDGTFGDAWAIAAGADIGSAYGELAAFTHPTYRMDSITFYDLGTQPNPVIFAPAVGAIGTSVSDAMPPNVALCVSHRTAVGGRSGHGRTYLGGWAENANTAEGGPHDDAVAAAQAWADALAAITGVEQAIVSYFEGHTFGGTSGHKKIPTPRVTPLVNRVTSSSVSTRWNTMRSRSNGR